MPNPLNQGAMVTFQHPVYAPHLIQELLQLFTPGVLVYPAGIHCHLEESPTMFLGDEILCFEKEL